MTKEIILLITVLLPVLAGALLPIMPLRSRRLRIGYVMTALAATAGLTVASILTAEGGQTIFKMTESVVIMLNLDNISKLFAIIAIVMWLLAGIYSVRYMEHEKNETRFYAFYLISLGMLLGMDFAGNLVTMYMFYEFVTLASMPLVLHSLTKESVSAALKYLFYSIGGAFLALFGIFFMAYYTDITVFTPGGSLDTAAIAGHEGIFLAAVFSAILGFGTKAGMFPMHGWLPAAHPVAPAPASAVLSGVIAKAGVLAVIRVVFFQTGADFIRGTWVQYAWMILALITVFMGSMMAYREKVMKKRLAYSTVSQVSYVLLGLSMLTADGVLGGLLHVVFHSIIKDGLFMAAGAIIFVTGCTRVDLLRGIGKKMPVTIWCWTLASLALIGIPPTCGFVSKWYLATASFAGNFGALTWIAPLVLIASALLTAGYLLPVTVNGFFPGDGYADEGRKEAPASMLVPILILAVLAVGLGIFAGGITEFLSSTACSFI